MALFSLLPRCCENVPALPCVPCHICLTRSNEANRPWTKPWESVSYNTSFLLLSFLFSFFFLIIAMESWPLKCGSAGDQYFFRKSISTRFNTWVGAIWMKVGILETGAFWDGFHKAGNTFLLETMVDTCGRFLWFARMKDGVDLNTVTSARPSRAVQRKSDYENTRYQNIHLGS